MNILTLNKKDGTTCEVEIVMTFNLENYVDDYVIYKLDNEYYGAKYYDDGVKTSLVTNLSMEEQQALNNAFETVMKEGVL